MKRLLSFDLIRKGGKWLVACHDWIIWNKIFGNGETIKWGSNEIIDPSMTMIQAEKMCAFVVAEFVNEFNTKLISSFRLQLHDIRVNINDEHKTIENQWCLNENDITNIIEKLSDSISQNI